MKVLGYYIFAIMYTIYRLFPIKEKHVLGIMTHDDGESGNVRIVTKDLERQDSNFHFSYITKKDTLDVINLKSTPVILSFFFVKPYQMARAEIILLDNVFLPMAFFHVRKQTKVIQLWHGTGTIKKFGQDVNVGRLKKWEYRSNQNITHLIVNSEETKELYSNTFGVRLNKVYAIGLPRTDELIQRFLKIAQEKKNHEKELIYRKYDIPLDKRFILYAPTFRDDEGANISVLHQLNDILSTLPEDCYLGLRLHPFIARHVEGKFLPERVIQCSFEKDLNGLMLASDGLITDYSSIVFEYCILEKPMVFFAYDLEHFSDHGRGFYYDYESYVPGPVFTKGNEVGRYFSEESKYMDFILEFREKNFAYLDGKAMERLRSLIIEE